MKLVREIREFVHYAPCEILATKQMLDDALLPNGTTLMDIRLQRIVRKNVFRLHKTTRSGPFDDTPIGKEIV